MQYLFRTIGAPPNCILDPDKWIVHVGSNQPIAAPSSIESMSRLSYIKDRLHMRRPRPAVGQVEGEHRKDLRSSSQRFPSNRIDLRRSRNGPRRTCNDCPAGSRDDNPGIRGHCNSDPMVAVEQDDTGEAGTYDKKELLCIAAHVKTGGSGSIGPSPPECSIRATVRPHLRSRIHPSEQYPSIVASVPFPLRKPGDPPRISRGMPPNQIPTLLFSRLRRPRSGPVKPRNRCERRSMCRLAEPALRFRDGPQIISPHAAA